MIEFDQSTRENIKKHYPNWSQIPDYLYRILITEGFESGKKIIIPFNKSATKYR